MSRKLSGFKLEPGDGMELTEAKDRGEGIGRPTVAEKKRERSEKRGKKGRVETQGRIVATKRARKGERETQ